MHILYLVHDLCDPAVNRRVKMLRAGGATVTLAGFSRSNDPGQELERTGAAINLGLTRNGDFGQRMIAVAKAMLSLGRTFRHIERPDLILARNLEMLALANRVSRTWKTPLAYESLDIHRLLLRKDPVGAMLRGVERLLANQVRFLVTSSPAFVKNYFKPYRIIDAPVILIENKVYGAPASQSPEMVRRLSKPWQIGWFGALRCRRSLEMLASFTREMDGEVEVVLRGRPSLNEFSDFEGFVKNEPFIRFCGPYRNPEDLRGIYEAVDFAWTIDFFEAGQNSDWLLPNRLYESCLYGVVPIALTGTQTASYLQQRNMGLILDDATPEALSAMFSYLDQAIYTEARTRIVLQPKNSWQYSSTDCVEFVEQFRQLAMQNQTHVFSQQIA
ncbi:glycosyltransferase [Phyllobacterium sp. SB3]|uniref:glycosyltransferase n=1 Tax=Phyllobacterium sp. SB3 TaxID=3156073 RepID=UPI0032AF5F97